MFLAKKMLCELVALPSVNNALLPIDHPFAGERRVGDYLAARARRAGMEVDWREVYPGRSNLLVRLSPIGRVQRRILLAPHLDTVGVTSVEQLTPREKSGRLYGRGACDTKGSAAVMMAALCELAYRHHRPKGLEIVFVGLADEEAGQTGSRALADSGFSADLAIVGEPTCLRIVTTHKGNVWLKMETHGRAAHGSRPDLGRNAVYEMAQIVDLLETSYAALLRRRHTRLLGHPTINVGTIEGGTQTNIVPARCSITIDRRTLPGETDAVVWRELRSLLRKNHLDAVLSNAKAAPCWPLETDPRLPLVQLLMRSARQTKTVGAGYFTDAGVLAHGGIPSVVFGPGSVAQAHTADEWISLAELERGQAILADFLSRCGELGLS